LPPTDVEPSGDDGALAVKAVEEAGLGPNDTILNTFNDAEKKKLDKMLSGRNSQFSRLEAGVIKMLMSDTCTLDELMDMCDAVNKKLPRNPEAASRKAGNAIKAIQTRGGDLEDVGTMIGSHSRRSKGAPVSKSAAIREINRILEIIAKRSKARFGKAIELQKIIDFRDWIRRTTAEKLKEYKKAQTQKRIYANKVAKEFYKLVADLHRTQDRHGLPRSEYYIDKFAPQDKDISKMKRFGGTPDKN